jgi:hypothetical protein
MKPIHGTNDFCQKHDTTFCVSGEGTSPGGIGGGGWGSRGCLKMVISKKPGNYGKIHHFSYFFMGEFTISMAIFNSYVM